jgi:hypothetical protein
MRETYRYATSSIAFQTLVLLPLTVVCAWLYYYSQGAYPIVFGVVSAGCVLYILNILRRAFETIDVDEHGVSHSSILGRTDFVAWADAAELRVASAKSPTPMFRVVSDSGESVKANSLLADYNGALDDVAGRVPARALLPLLRSEALDVRILGLDTLVRRSTRDAFFCKTAAAEISAEYENTRPLPVSHRDVEALLRLGTPEARALASGLVERSDALDREGLRARLTFAAPGTRGA